MQVRIRRPMLIGVLCCFLLALLPVLLMGPSPLAWVVAGGFVAGLGVEVFSVVWNTALHTHVAPEALSRVSAYDVVGSILFAPVGEAFAGTLIAAIGAPTTLRIATALIVIPTLLVLTVPEVRQLRDKPND
jgi:MFS family permease